MRNPKLVLVLKSDSHSENASVCPLCNALPIQLYAKGAELDSPRMLPMARLAFSAQFLYSLLLLASFLIHGLKVRLPKGVIMFLLYHNLLLVHFKEVCVQHNINDACGKNSVAYTFHVASNIAYHDRVVNIDCRKQHPLVRDRIYLRHNGGTNQLGYISQCPAGVLITRTISWCSSIVVHNLVC